VAQLPGGPFGLHENERSLGSAAGDELSGDEDWQDAVVPIEELDGKRRVRQGFAGPTW
jgi:hypothetical protein